jgi:hypothetical protein
VAARTGNAAAEQQRADRIVEKRLSRSDRAEASAFDPVGLRGVYS